MTRPTFNLQRILVPVDFSDPSEQALQYASIFAMHLGAKITLLHVLESGPLIDEISEIDTTATSRRAAERLSLLASRYGEPNLFDKMEVRGGSPSQQIGLAASEFGSDLIVIATHGYTGLEYMLLGGIAERVVRHAPCPVLVARKKETGMSEPRKILVPVDFSPASLDGLRYALGLARPFGARLTVLHVVEPLGPMMKLAVDAHSHHKKLREGAKLRLDVLHLDVDEPAGEFNVVVRIGPSYHEIIAMAQEGNFDLVVMASLGRTELTDRLLGSTAERVVRHALCPVLVARGKVCASKQTGQSSCNS